MKSASPLVSDIVLLGGGHAHAHILKMFGMPPLRSILASNGIQVTLISSTVLTPYSGMLPGYVAGHYESKDIHLDLCKLCSFSGIRFIHAAAIGIVHNHDGNNASADASAGGGGGWVICSDGRPNVRYDVLSIDIGSSPSIPSELLSWTPPVSSSLSSSSTTLDVTGSVAVMVTPVKPIATFSTRWNGICQRLEQSHRDMYSPSNPFVLVVVGGGAGGIELALSVQYKLQHILMDKGISQSDAQDCIRIILVTKGMEILPSHNERVRGIFQRILKERGIEVRYGAEAVGVGCDGMTSNSENDATTTQKSLQPLQQDAVQQRKKQSLKLSNTSVKQTAIYFDECLWCTSAGSSSWVKDHTPFDKTEDGFFQVRGTYESVSHRGVFAAGDCCHMVDNPRPKAGVFAVRAGPILCDNLIAYLLNQPLTVHEPQKEFLGLISTGNKYAVASRGQHALEGEFLWTLKDQIDRAWMNMYQILPSMEEDGENDETATVAVQRDYVPPALASRGQDALAAFREAPMRCGGCGAKVGSQTLTRVLEAVYQRRSRIRKKESTSSSLSSSTKPRKIDPDDAAIILIPHDITKSDAGGGGGGTEGKQGALIQTIDFFRSFISDPFVFGKIAAVHALSDCHAMGAKAQTALALAVVKFSANEEITERTLIDMLSGASDVLDQEGCELVGGHTCEGAEEALGFTVSGFVNDASTLLRKRGGKIGDKIILTKAIGTGALFAANMRAKCEGESISLALESMMTSNGSASRIAMTWIEKTTRNKTDRGIHACTDVTGFGLCGHLLEMLLANDDSDDKSLDSIAAELDLNAIPFLQGAIQATQDGITSSLYRENSRSRRAVANHEEAACTHPETYPLLFDPQTAGGLLFFVSPDICDDFVKELSADPGTRVAAIIGQLTDYSTQTWNRDSCEMADSSCMQTTNRIHIKMS